MKNKQESRHHYYAMADIGGWKDLGTMRKIYTHLAERDIAKRSKEFTDYFTPEAMKNRKIGNDTGNEN